MKKKPLPPSESETVVDQRILETAKAALRSDHIPPRAKRCSICGSDAAPNSNESLCWVCRRLKISAWRDSDQQLNAQE